MKREIFNKLKKWKDNPNRKPLLLKGARQVGKTWIMQNFGKTYYKDVLYINFEKDKNYIKFFEENLDPKNIVLDIEIYINKKINLKDTLIIFDEVQECPTCLESMKYFCEEDEEYNIMLAGSLLGVALHSGISFPVGKIEEINVYPMTFLEFLYTQNEILAEKLKLTLETFSINTNNENIFKIINNFHEEINKYLKIYYIVGGMPEVINIYNDTKDFNKVRERQNDIIAQYKKDLSKHIDTTTVPRARMVYDAIPIQLAKENKKFFFGIIKEGARIKDYEIAIEWLEDCGLIKKINKIRDVKFPLKAYEDFSSFKIYFSDIGLLSAISELDSRIILEGDKIYTEFKGALTEQFVNQEMLSAEKHKLYYYSSEKSRYEIDFIAQVENMIIPIEVKAEENLKAKSLKVFIEKFDIKKAIKLSLKPYRLNEIIINMPLYGSSAI